MSGTESVDVPEVAKVFATYPGEICNTDLVENFRLFFGDALNYDGKRAVEFSVGDELPVNELRECITMALTYHLAKVGS